MTEPDRHITDADARAIADAIAGTSREARLDAGKRTMGDLMRSDAAGKKARTNARVLSRINQPAPTAGE
jgi:hypothetical protein